jgi:hypothetical protein
VPEFPQPEQPDPTVAALKLLTEAIATLKTGDMPAASAFSQISGDLFGLSQGHKAKKLKS